MMESEAVQVNVGQIRDHFQLPDMGEAWNMVIDRGWECERPIPGDESSGPWVVTVPRGEWDGTPKTECQEHLPSQWERADGVCEHPEHDTNEDGSLKYPKGS